MAKKNKTVETKDIQLSDGSTATITMRLTGRAILDARKERTTEDEYELTVALAAQVTQIDGKPATIETLLDDIALSDLTEIIKVVAPLMGNGQEQSPTT